MQIRELDGDNNLESWDGDEQSPRPRPVATSAVLISATPFAQGVKIRAEMGDDVMIFSDAEPLAALEAINLQRPPVIAIERTFAATPRGVALINRIKADENLDETTILVVSHDSDYVRVVPRPAEGSHVARAEYGRLLDPKGTRRAPRFAVGDQLVAEVDGSPVRLVNLSAVGAQVISRAILKPNQRVRVLIGKDAELRCNASIAWSTLEQVRDGSQPQYRVGVEFLDADSSVATTLCEVHGIVTRERPAEAEASASPAS